MKKYFKQHKGLSLIEIIVATTLLSLVIFGVIAGISSWYKQIRITEEFTGNIFEVKSALENAGAFIRDANLKPNEYMSKPLEDKVTKLGVELNLNSFTMFNNRAKVTGYNLKRPFASRGKLNYGGPRAYNMFITTNKSNINSGPEMMHIRGKIEYKYEEKRGLEIKEHNFAVTNPDFIYGNPDIYFTGVYQKGSKYGAYNAHKFPKTWIKYMYFIDVKYTPGTTQHVYLTKFSWYASKVKDESYSGEINNKIFYPYFSDENGIPPSGEGIPERQDMYELKNKKSYFDRNDLKLVNLQDQYLIGTARSVSKKLITSPESSTKLVWVIGLPITKNILFHFDTQFEGGWLEPGEEGRTSKLSELSSETNLTQPHNPEQAKLLGHRLKIQRNQNAPYDKYGKFRRNRFNIDKTYSKSVGDGKPDHQELTMFAIIRPITRSTIIQRKRTVGSKPVWDLSYDGSNFVVRKSNGGLGLITKSYRARASRNRWQLVTIKVTAFRLDIQVNNSRKSGGTVSPVSLDFRRYAPLIIGGGGSFDMKEIVGFKTTLSDKEIRTMNEYFMKKYSNILN